MSKLKHDLAPSGYMEERKQAERAHNLLALKLVEGKLSNEEKAAYLNELSVRVACRYFLWEYMERPKG